MLWWMDLLSAVAAMVREELDREVETGFPRLRRIPSTGTIKFLDHFEPLPPAERAPLLDMLARVGAMQFLPPPLIVAKFHEVQSNDPAWSRFWDSMNSPHFSYGLRYCDLRMARMMLNDAESMAHMAQTRAKLDFQPRDDPPKELLPDPDLRRAQPAKAPLLRKLLNPALGRLMSAKATKRPGGEVVYSGVVGNTPLTVSFLFSNRFGQMHYAVKASMPERQILALRLAYETLWGSNVGWDYLTEENAPRSIDLLCELLTVLAQLLERIAALPPASSG